MMYLVELCWEFFKTGLFAIGGGLATLPFLSQMSTNYQWFSQNDIGNMLAVSESTPGPIGVNMATYAGNMVGTLHGGVWMGIACGVLSTLFLVLPSYLVILVIQKVMSRFSENRYVQGAMKTLRPASVGMVTAAVCGILQSVLFNFDAARIGQWNRVVLYPNVLLFAILLVVYLRYNKLHPVLVLSVGAVAGIIFKL